MRKLNVYMRAYVLVMGPVLENFAPSSLDENIDTYE